jgi:phosphoglycolate phosphatase
VDYVAGYDSGFGTKPEPGMVLGFCAATGLDPTEIAVVGDNNHDLHMGRNAKAGVTVAVLTGTGSRESLAAASDYCLNDITELEGLLPDLQLA